MNKANSSIKIILAVTFLLILIIGIIVYSSSQGGLSNSNNTNQPISSNTLAKSNQSNISSTNNENVAKAGEYKTYNQDELKTAKDGQKLLLFFNASWCPSCRSTVKDIDTNKDKINSNITILSADFDKEVDLKKKYGVTMQHTFVEVDRDGNLIKKTTGLSTVDAINNYLK